MGYANLPITHVTFRGIPIIIIGRIIIIFLLIVTVFEDRYFQSLVLAVALLRNIS